MIFLEFLKSFIASPKTNNNNNNKDTIAVVAKQLLKSIRICTDVTEITLHKKYCKLWMVACGRCDSLRRSNQLENGGGENIEKE